MGNVELFWLKHSGFKMFFEGKVFYVDPFKLYETFKTEELEKADFVFITHSHFDHCDLDSLKLIVSSNTVVFCSFDCNSKVSKLDVKDVVLVKPGMVFDKSFFEKFNVNFSFNTVPAFNVDKEFHPKENNWVGYVLDFDGFKIYHVGDSDDIKENYGLNVNIVLVPVSGVYVMNSVEAFNFVSNLFFDIAIPIHFGLIVGSLDDALNFKDLVENNIDKGKVVIPELYKNLLE